MKYVLDSCALIAYIRDEQGADMVEQIFLDDTSVVLMHAVNACEVYYDCIRTIGEEQADTLIESLTAGNVTIRDDMDEAFWKFAGKIKSSGRISLADTFALSLAAREDAVLLTSDRHEFEPLIAKGDLPVTINFIR